MPQWDANLTNLNSVLAALYPTIEDSRPVVSAAGIPTTHVTFQNKAINNWYEILMEANNRSRVPNLIQVALKDYPDHSALLQAQKGRLSPVQAPIIGEDLTWNAVQDNTTIEKIIGRQSTLLPISFLEIGLQRARSVARVLLSNGEAGSGFLVRDNLFITNHHVLDSVEQATTAIVQFNFQKTVSDLDCVSHDFHFDPENGFATSAEEDWTIVRLRGDANAEWGVVDVTPTVVGAGERVNIIQHPSGGPKQIALYHNVVTYADKMHIQYLTDTLPGSSGSPVFDSQWRLVGIHHSGGWLREPGTKKQVFRNEGITVACLVEGLAHI